MPRDRQRSASSSANERLERRSRHDADRRKRDVTSDDEESRRERRHKRRKYSDDESMEDTEDRKYRRRSRSISKGDERRKEHKRRDRSRSRDRERRRRDRSRSRSPRRHRKPRRDNDRSASPRRSHKSSRRERDRRRHEESASLSPPPQPRSRAPLPDQDVAFGVEKGNISKDADGKPIEKQKPNYGNTGLLARETNTVAGTKIVLKYNEPADSRKPPLKQAWRMYIFKGSALLDTVPLHTRSCWLIGREAQVADLLVEHPSTSSQHAVIQFRYTARTNVFGDKDSRVRPYLIDLESSNGTMVNGEKVEASRFIELMDGDLLKLGSSEREYVVQLPPTE